MSCRAIIAAVGGAALFATSPCAGAGPPTSPPDSKGTTQAPDKPKIANDPAVSDTDLGTLRGGDGHSIIISNQTLSAVTTGNVINGGYTAGPITISDSAFSNFNGLGNVIINTGAQVSLQSGMNVTINTSP